MSVKPVFGTVQEPPQRSARTSGTETAFPRGAATPPYPPINQGLMVLGTPLGHPAYVAHRLQSLLQDHRAFLDCIPAVPDLQAAWLLLCHCAGPRANYYLRALPPEVTAEFADGHDQALWTCFCSLLDIDPAEASPQAPQIAQLPLRLGGLGLRSAVRLAPAAYWASWADALAMIARRHPVEVRHIVDHLARGSESNSAVLRQAAAGALTLAAEGFTEIPTWQALAAGARPEPPEDREPGEWAHGWQFYAAAARDESFPGRFSRLYLAPARPFSGPRAARGRVPFSRPPQPPPSRPLTLPSFVSSSFGDSECTSPPPPAAASAAGFLTRLATTVQHAEWRGSWGNGGSPSRQPQRAFAERLVAGFLPTSSCAT